MRGPASPPAPDVAAPHYRDARDSFIGDVVAGRSFCDVGGLWGTVRERVSVAHEAGASSVTMLDVTAWDDPLWAAFRQRMLHLKVSPFASISRDVHAFDGPPFQIVHCSGVLYHCPDPLRFLRALRRMTIEYCILSSSITGERVSNAAGVLQVPAGGWLFLPGLSGVEREILVAQWHPHVGDTAIGLTTEQARYAPDDWAPWYWLPTVSALAAMARVAGFAVLDAAPIWYGNAHTLLLGALP